MKNSKFILGKDVFDKKVRIKVSDLKFRVSVYGVVIKNGKVLLIKCFDGYDFPGGGVKIDELIPVAFIREVWEETGLKVKQGRLLEVRDAFFQMPVSNEQVHSVQIFYEGKNPTGQITDANFDTEEKEYAQKAEWVDLKNIKKIKFYNGINSQDLIKKLLK